MSPGAPDSATSRRAPGRRAPRALLLALALAGLGAAPARAQAGPPAAAAGDADFAVIASWTVTTELRTLRGCPLKRVITDQAGWDRVTAWLDGAPPAPDLAGRHVVLVVADVTGGAATRVGAPLRRPDGSVVVRLDREDPPGASAVVGMTLQCAFFLVPAFPGGVALDVSTALPEGGGSIVRPVEPDPALERDPARLPQLGADLRLTIVTADGRPLPRPLFLRQEARWPRPDLKPQVTTIELGAPRVGLGFPRLRDGVRVLFAAHAEGLRSRSALLLERLPAPGPDGSPAVVHHRLTLEPVGGAR